MRTLFIGPLGGGKKTDGGSIIKNIQLVEKLSEYFKIIKFDTTFWKKKPWMILNIVINILLNSRCDIIISTSYKSAYNLLKLFYILRIKNNIFYWVIGGEIANKITNENLNVKYYLNAKKIIVEGEKMKDDLNKIGIDNVIVMPNFKKIYLLPQILDNSNKNIFKFVFLSRITELKGCEIIFEACKILNQENYIKNYSVSFYGPIDDSYKQNFQENISTFKNTSYNGFLDLNVPNNYIILAEYDCLLFPTFWPTEGFPGIIIDAYISGLPIICSDWNLNKDLVVDGINGYIIPPKDAKTLAKIMKYVIDNKNQLKQMRIKNQKASEEYNIDSIITKENLQSLGFNL